MKPPPPNTHTFKSKEFQQVEYFEVSIIVKPGFHCTANDTTTTQKQSDYNVEQSSFTLIALFSLEIGGCRGRCRGRNWLNGNQALSLHGAFKNAVFSASSRCYISRTICSKSLKR